MRKTTKKFIIILILIGSILLYFPPFYEKEIQYETWNMTNITLNLQDEVFDKPGPLSFFRKVTSPFELKYYDLYLNFKPKGTCPFSIYPIKASYFLDGKEKEYFREKKGFIDTLKIDRPHKIEIYNVVIDYGEILEEVYNMNLNIKYAQMLKEIEENSSLTEECTITAEKEFQPFLVAKIHFWDFMGNSFISFFAYSGIFLIIISLYEWVNKKNTKK